jgi:YHS domain-containing protein
MSDLLDALVLCFVVFSAIRFVSRFVHRFRAGSEARSPLRTAASADPGATLLHQDPVCGTYVATDTSLKQIVRGRVVHFCSAECRDRYRG